MQELGKRTTCLKLHFMLRSIGVLIIATLGCHYAVYGGEPLSSALGVRPCLDPEKPRESIVYKSVYHG